MTSSLFYDLSCTFPVPRVQDPIPCAPPCSPHPSKVLINLSVFTFRFTSFLSCLPPCRIALLLHFVGSDISPFCNRLFILKSRLVWRPHVLNYRYKPRAHHPSPCLFEVAFLFSKIVRRHRGGLSRHGVGLFLSCYSPIFFFTPYYCVPPGISAATALR